MTGAPPPPPGAHGGDGAAIARWLGVPVDEVLDLSACLNPFAPDVAGRLADHASAVDRYADARPTEHRLAEVMRVDPALLLLTNGASEAIALVAGFRPQGDVQDPEFSLYRRHLGEVRPGAPRWRSNPHSPTGRLARPEEAAAVWDEAYWPIATGTWTRGDHLDGSIVIGSLTKLFACPGLRLGYVLAPDVEVATALRDRRPEWSVGALALAVLDDLLADPVAIDLASSARRVRDARQDLVRALVVRGWDVDVADAPWVLVHDAPDLRADLAHHRVVVRDCTSFGLCDTVRIGVPAPTDLARLTDALDAVSRKDR